MSRYETYKPSGIDWIGEVPEHWKVKRLKSIVLNDIGGLWGDEPADDENDIIVLRVADFDRTNSRIIDNPDFTYRNIKSTQLEGRLIKQGDILLEKSGGGEQQPVGKAVLFDKDFKAVTSNFINKIETIPSVNNHFALYLFDALYYNNINVRNIKQTTGIQNLDSTGFFWRKDFFTT
jgi:type I restriction enzyme S subunit